MKEKRLLLPTFLIFLLYEGIRCFKYDLFSMISIYILLNHLNITHRIKLQEAHTVTVSYICWKSLKFTKMKFGNILYISKNKSNPPPSDIGS